VINGKIDPMIQCIKCDNWFHQHCLSIDDVSFGVLSKDNVKWNCSECEFSTLKVTQLKEMLKQKNLPLRGPKQELVERLIKSGRK